MKDRDVSQRLEDYQGRETLGDLSLAKNYNSHLTQLIVANCKPGSIVVDFGAGNGAFAAEVAKSVLEVSALEPDLELQIAIKGKGIRVLAIQDIEPASVDVIYSLNVLEHIKDDVSAVRELASKLKPEGRLVIYVPALEVLYSRFDNRIGHYRRYNKKRLRATLEQAGYEVSKLDYYDPIGFFAALAYRLLDNSGQLKTGSIRIFDRLLYPLSRVMQPLTAALFGKNLLAVARLAQTRPDA